MTPADLFIAGVAAYIPPVLSAAEAVQRGWYSADSFHEDGWIGAAVAEEDQSPADMAVIACKSALSRSGVELTDLDILLYVGSMPQGPHCWSPQQYVERQVVGRDIPAVQLRQGCTGILDAFDLAAGYLAIPGRHAALVTGADNFGIDPAFGPDPTMRWRYAGNGRTNRGSIIGDAATAAILSNRSGFARILSLATRSLSMMEELFRGGEPLFPPAHGSNRPTIGERFSEFGRLNPGALLTAFLQLKKTRTELAIQVLEESGVRADQVTRVLHVFSGTDRYIKDALKPLGIDTNLGMLDFGRGVGHLGVNDQLVGLEHLVMTEQVGPGDHVLMMCNGAASLASAVVSITERPVWDA